MATRTLCQDICYGYNVFYENCICEDCIEKEETRNSIFFENQLRVDPEASSEFKSMDVVENLRPKTLDEISEMETCVSEKTHFTNEDQKKEIGKSSKEHVFHINTVCNLYCSFTYSEYIVKIGQDFLEIQWCIQTRCLITKQMFTFLFVSMFPWGFKIDLVKINLSSPVPSIYDFYHH